MKIFKQIIYYGDKNKKNYPSNVSKALLTSADEGVNGIIINSLSIAQFGIQAQEGFRYYIPMNKNNVQTMTLGKIGIESFDFTKCLKVKNIYFNEEDIDQYIDNQNPLIIDLIYDDGE